MTDWNSTYVEHGPAVLAYLRRRVGQPEVAEDLYQETFARAMRSSTAIRDATRIRSYLFQTAHNLLVNHLRRPQHLVRSESDLGDAVELAEFPDAKRASPEAELSNRELREQLELAIGQLTGDRRKAFKLAILERRPYREVAEHTGWSLAKVKITVFRARRQLMSLLADGESDHEAL